MKYTSAEEINFKKFIDELVLEAYEGGIERFDNILTSLPGVYPSKVMDSLKRLVSNRNLPRRILSNAIKKTSICNQKSLEIDSVSSYHNKLKRLSLPIPHPLDYDWRFADRAINFLLEKCLELTDPSDKVILLGTPSILSKAMKKRFPRKIMLFEKGQAITDTLMRVAPKNCVFQCDLTTDLLPNLSAKAIVCDSPWYLEYIESFLWSAAQFCTINGYLLFSMPPAGTRPKVRQEWAIILEWANKLGFKLINILFDVLPYVSPPFEQNALRAEGLINIPAEWRSSNLALFIRKYKRGVPRPPSCSIDGNWSEEVSEGIRIRFRCSNHLKLFEDPTLQTIVHGDILPSVSRWDGRRKFADIWTSGNRIYGCRGSGLLLIILRALTEGQKPEQMIAIKIRRGLSRDERKMVFKASDQIERVIKLERDEYMNYVEDK